MKKNEIKIVMDNIFSGIGFKTIRCPEYELSPLLKDYPEMIFSCLVSQTEPEDVLPKLSQQMEKYGDVKMGWRMDMGRWLSTYDWSGEKFNISITLQSPGQSELMSADPAMKNVGSLATYLISPIELSR